MSSQMSIGASLHASGVSGRMTAVMRAAAKPAAKVLRIGLVVGGRILEERLVKDRGTVTVGSSETATFVTSGARTQFPLFERIGSDYVLNFDDGMAGRIANATGISDLATLRSHARRVRDHYQVRLTEDARGKVVLGESTFLFQFVAPPPANLRPRLPVSVMSGNQMDWGFTIVCAVSLLFHVATILVLMPGGHAFASDRAYDGEYRARDVSDTQSRVPDAVAEMKPEDAQAALAAAEQATEETTPKKPIKPSSSPVRPQTPAQNEDTRARDLVARAEAMRLDLIAAVHASSDRVIGGNPGHVVATTSKELQEVAESTSRTRPGTFDPGPGTAVLDPNGHDRLTEVGPGTKTIKDTDTSGPGADRHDIKIGVSAAASTIAGPAVANAQSIVAGLAGRVRFCYTQGLDRNQNMSGRVAASFSVGPSGDVRSVSLSPSGSVDSTLVSCVQSIVSTARFGQDPARTTSTIAASFNFVKQ